MRFAKLTLLLAAITSITSIASAQAPVQATPAKVGIINSEMFSNPNGGITRLINALRTLDNEFKPRRDEITQLRTRFESIQQVPPNTPPAQLATRREQAENLQIEIQRKQEDARVAYGKRLSALTDPIRVSILTALDAFGKQRGIDVLIDRSKFPDGVFVLNPSADLTATFIRDFNSRNP